MSGADRLGPVRPSVNDPTGTRTRVLALRGLRPRPLDDRATTFPFLSPAWQAVKSRAGARCDPRPALASPCRFGYDPIRAGVRLAVGRPGSTVLRGQGMPLLEVH